MKKVRVIGVPEHFNLPWHMAIEEGAFAARGIELRWTDIPEGTGRMCKMLGEGEADLAIILTEGVVKSIVDGNEVKIVQEYIKSPLQWGIHVAAHSKFTKVPELQNAKAAISRFGSGSHLMAYVHAQNQGWDTQNLKFEVVNTLEGAIEALEEGKADYFMWEHFTTKPVVDRGTFRRLADCPTPWPCFVIVGRTSFLIEDSSVLQHILDVINLYTKEFKQIPSIDRSLSNRYQQKLEDIQNWLEITNWSQDQLNSYTLDNVQDKLLNLKLVNNKLDSSKVLFSFNN